MSTFKWWVYLRSHNKEIENTCNRIKMKREFIRICCMRLKLLNAIQRGVLNKVWKQISLPFLFITKPLLTSLLRTGVMIPLAGEDLVPSPPGTTHPLVSPVVLCPSVHPGPEVTHLLRHLTSQAHYLSFRTFPFFSYSFSNTSSFCPTMWEMDHKKGWAPKNWGFQTMVLSPLDSKEIESVNPKANQPWIFIGGTDAEVPIFWPPDTKRQLIGKDPDAGKDWGQEEKRATGDEMVRQHHWPKMDMNLSQCWEIVKDREAWCAAHGGRKA